MRLRTGLLVASFAVNGVAAGCGGSTDVRGRQDASVAYAPAEQQGPLYNITCFDREAGEGADPESSYWKARFEQRPDGDGIGTQITIIGGASFWRGSKFR